MHMICMVSPLRWNLNQVMVVEERVLLSNFGHVSELMLPSDGNLLPWTHLNDTYHFHPVQIISAGQN